MQCKHNCCIQREVDIRLEKLGTTVGTVEEEWKAFKDAFVGVAEELCGRTSGRGDHHQKGKTKLGGRKK